MKVGRFVVKPLRLFLQVFGIEMNASAVSDAERNEKINGIRI